tara:strand:- start:324 stop:575 length:252 start_codon:yes stop_codon:yes gene_type:complete
MGTSSINFAIINNMEPNNEPSIQEQLNAQQQALTKIYTSVEKTRKYILWTGIVSAVMFLLPLIGLAIAVPIFMRNLTAVTGLF